MKVMQMLKVMMCILMEEIVEEEEVNKCKFK